MANKNYDGQSWSIIPALVETQANQGGEGEGGGKRGWRGNHLAKCNVALVGCLGM